MKNRRLPRLSEHDKSVQREIARRLKLGLPLTGLLTAALLCGCGEQTGGHLQGVPVPPGETRGTASRTDRPTAGGEHTPGTDQAEYERKIREIEKLLEEGGERFPAMTMGLYIPDAEEQARRARLADEMKELKELKEKMDRKAAEEKASSSGAISTPNDQNESGGAGK